MSPEEIRVDAKKSHLKTIYDCLMYSQCMQQYTKYGSYMPLEQQFQAYDFRMGQQMLFYICFCMFTGMISRKDHSLGISFSRAVAIVFVLNEIEQLLYFSKLIEAGGDKENTLLQQNTRLKLINSLFPSTYCVFEKVEV